MATEIKEKQIRVSRVGKQPVVVQAGVNVAIDGQHITLKGKKGSAELQVHPWVAVRQQGDSLVVNPHQITNDPKHRAMTGTMRTASVA